MRALSAEEFGIVLAHLEHFRASDLDAVLAQLQIHGSTFLDAAAAIPLELASEPSDGAQPVARAFDDALARTRLRLADERPLLRQVDALRAAPRVAAASSDQDVTLSPVTGAGSRPATPFAAGPAASPAASRPRDPQPVPLEAGDTIGLEDGLGVALPFAAANYAHWTVERYASFSAERRFLDPETVRLTYGVRDGGEEHGLLVHFNLRFGREPGLRDRWVELVQKRTRELGEGA